MKIALFTKPYIIKVCSLFMTISIITATPLMASAFWPFDGNKAQADTEDTSSNADVVNSQNMDLLTIEPSVNPDIKNADTQTDPIITQNESFISSDEIYVPDVKFEKSTISDQISVYTVEKGDTLSEIADDFDVSVNTIRWENNISGNTVSVGQKLNILPMTGVKHIVKSGDTVSKIADKYEADVDDILIFNGISKGDALKQGDIIFVPNGIIKTVSVPKTTSGGSGKIEPSYDTNITKAPSGYYMRPVPGPVTSPYGSRHGGFHPGVDLGGSRGETVLAAASGVVVISINGCVEGRKSCGGGYGNHIAIEHPNGTMTIYGHLTKAIANVGQSISQGDEIGTLGSTGNSTGPHVHFEIRNSNGSTMRPPVY